MEKIEGCFSITWLNCRKSLMSGDPIKSEPIWKCFKRCCVSKRLPYTMSVFCNFFRHGNSRELRISGKRQEYEVSYNIRFPSLQCNDLCNLRSTRLFLLKIFMSLVHLSLLFTIVCTAVLSSILHKIKILSILTVKVGRLSDIVCEILLYLPKPGSFHWKNKHA